MNLSFEDVLTPDVNHWISGSLCMTSSCAAPGRTVRLHPLLREMFPVIDNQPVLGLAAVPGSR
jgi:hypothetical protein